MDCREMSIQELKQTLFRGSDVQIIDVREVHEYRAGHIEGSMLIPLSVLPHRLDLVNRDSEVILVCRSGNRSKEACQVLQAHGFRNMKSLRGGLSSWSA